MNQPTYLSLALDLDDLLGSGENDSCRPSEYLIFSEECFFVLSGEGESSLSLRLGEDLER